jgi:serine phosphatase RsbU (regulator of sigma subunit)
MKLPGNFLYKLIFVMSSCTLFFGYANAQKWSIEVRGTVSEKGKTLAGSVISLYADSNLLRTVTSVDGEFDFTLQRDSDYMFSFSKPGYVTKCVNFSTKDVPEKRAREGFTPYDIDVEIFREVPGIDVGQLLKAPLALIRYDANFNNGDFTYDLQYAKDIRPFMKVLDFEMRQAVKRAELEKQDALHNAELKRQKIIIYSAGVILILVMGFAVFAFISFRQKQKINQELDTQNKSVEEKNREITDSINYAKRIQNAILPEMENIRQVLPDSFIFFRPKDIVSGDFYFFFNNNEKVFLGAADCTGHGVPGAFMSLIGYEKLYDASHQTNHPGEILALVNRAIRTALRQSSDLNSTRDGMDIALLSMEKKDGGMSLSFSGANRPLWIVRKDSAEVEEIKATKKAIAGFTDEAQQFDMYQTHVKQGDTFYIFSDGYPDQFGGNQGKKLTTKRFKDLLKEIKLLSMKDQGIRLEKFIDEWKVKEEQLDDILVIGVRV